MTTQPQRCCPRQHLNCPSGSLLSQLPQTEVNYNSYFTSKPPGSPPSPVPGVGTVRQFLPPPVVPNLGSFPLLYSKTSGLPPSPCPGGDYRKVAVPSTGPPTLECLPRAPKTPNLRFVPPGPHPQDHLPPPCRPAQVGGQLEGHPQPVISRVGNQGCVAPYTTGSPQICGIS